MKYTLTFTADELQLLVWALDVCQNDLALFDEEPGDALLNKIRFAPVDKEPKA